MDSLPLSIKEPADLGLPPATLVFSLFFLFWLTTLFIFYPQPEAVSYYSFDTSHLPSHPQPWPEHA